MTVTAMQVFEIAALVLAVATAVARITPTTKDDGWVEKARKFLENLGNMFLKDRK